MEILKKLANDKEYKKLREEWGLVSNEPFPLFHHTQYLGIDDYKDKLKEKLKEQKKHPTR